MGTDSGCTEATADTRELDVNLWEVTVDTQELRVSARELQASELSVTPQYVQLVSEQLSLAA